MRQFKTIDLRTGNKSAANSTYKKLADQWLHEALCFVSSSVVAVSFRLRNRQLLVGKTLAARLRRHIKLLTIDKIMLDNKKIKAYTVTLKVRGDKGIKLKRT